MKHEILEEVWRARDKIAAECNYDLKRLAARMHRLETKYADRLAPLPIRRTTKATSNRRAGPKRMTASDQH